MKSRLGLIILLTGVLCVAAAAGLFVFNTVRSAQAGDESRRAVEVLTEVIGKEAAKPLPFFLLFGYFAAIIIMRNYRKFYGRDPLWTIKRRFCC